MKNYVKYIYLYIFLITSVCHAGNEANIFCKEKFIVPLYVPGNMLLSYSAYSSTNTLEIRQDIGQKICEDEKLYTWNWIRNAVSYEIGNQIGSDDMVCVTGVGNRLDDAICVKNKLIYNNTKRDNSMMNISNYSVEIIDARIFNLLIYEKNQHENQIDALFKKYFYDHIYKRDSFECNQIYKYSEFESAGKITITSERGGYIEKPIEWYRNGDTTLFVFEKIIKLPTTPYYDISILLESNEEFEKFVGGISVENDSTFVRFESGSRINMTREYMLKYYHLKND
jgi:hypothetical protein